MIDNNIVEIEEIIDLQNKITKWKEKAKKVQASFDFVIPNYIIDEIISNGIFIYKNHENLYSLINCAVVNGRLTKENANILKEKYK